MNYQGIIKTTNMLTQSVTKMSYMSPSCHIIPSTELGLKLNSLSEDVLKLSNVKFKPAKTIEEACERAISEYGIKSLKIQNIDVANDTLYALHTIKSKSITMLGIEEIIEVPIIQNNPDIMGSICTTTGVMKISDCGLKRTISNKMSKLSMTVPPDKMNEYQNLLIKMSEGKIPLFRLTQDMEKMGIKASSLSELPFQTILHEQGHRAHYLNMINKDDYWMMGKLAEIKEMGITNYSVYEEFVSPEIQNTIKSWPFLGDYACTSPCEFVAEVYSALIHGIKVPDNIMKLYYKYHGPKVIC